MCAEEPVHVEVLIYPVDIYLIPSMVSDVAAILVATTTFLTDGLGGSNTLFCSSERKYYLNCYPLKTVTVLIQTNQMIPRVYPGYQKFFLTQLRRP